MRAALAMIRGRSPDAAPSPGQAAVVARQDSGAAIETVPAGAEATGPVAEPSDSVAAVSGPIFDLGTARVGEGAGGASGPVFEMVSGPVSGSTDVVRGPAVDAPSRSTALTPTPSAAAAFVPVAAETSGAVDSASWSADVATLRVPGAAVAQKVGPGFAATLLGLPGPEQEAIQAALAAARKRSPGADAPEAGGARPAARGDRGAMRRNAPVAIEADATERNLLASGDARAAAAGWGRGANEQKRITEVVDVVRPAGPSRLKVALVVGAGLMGITAIVIAGVARKANKANGAASTAAKSSPAEQPRPPALKLAPEPEPEPEPASANADRGPTEAEVPAQAAVTEAEAAESPPSPVGPPPRHREGKTTKHSGSARAAVAEAPERTGSTEPAAAGADGKPKVTRADIRRSETRHAEAKTRRRIREGRAGAKAQAPTAAAYEQAGGGTRRLTVPSRGGEADPDGVMPLGTR